MKHSRILLDFFLVLSLLGCAGSPETSMSGSVGPEWIEAPPGPTEDFRYVYALGRDPAGSLDAAESAAMMNAATKLTDQLVENRSDLTAEERRFVSGFSSRIVSSLRGELDLDGVRLEERFDRSTEDTPTDGAAVHLLVRVSEAFMRTQRNALDSIVSHEVQTVTAPEREAESLESRGEYLQAGRAYIEAAVAAITSELPDKELRFARNLGAAKNILTELTIEKRNDNLVTSVGTEFSQPFRSIVTIGGRPVSGADLIVHYATLEPNGGIGRSSTRIVTDAEGIATFQHPIPRFVGQQTLSMTLDAARFVEPLDDLPSQRREPADELLETLSGKRVLFRYTVESEAASIPTAVTLVATDLIGNPMEGGALETGFIEQLQDADFDVRRLHSMGADLVDADAEDLLEQLRAATSGEVQRVIFGVAAIEEFNERDGIVVSVSGDAAVMRLADGEIIQRVEAIQHSRATNSGSAIAAAFRGLGEKLAEELVRKLSGGAVPTAPSD